MMLSITKNKLLYPLLVLASLMFGYFLFTPTASANNPHYNDYGVYSVDRYTYIYEEGGSLVRPDDANSDTNIAIGYTERQSRSDGDGIEVFLYKTAYDSATGDYRFEGGNQFLIVNEDSPLSATVYTTIDGEEQTVSYSISDNRSLSAQALDGSASNTSTGAPPSSATPVNTEQPETETCDSQGIALGWIICRLLDLADSALVFADTAIVSLFEVDSAFYDNDGIKGAWTNMRNLAYIIIVPVFIVMVISTALGFDFVSAYTVKKSLPRLIIATVFIAFSYEIAVFAIQVTDIIARGIAGFVYTPFGVNEGDLTLQALFEWEISEVNVVARGIGNVGVAILIGAGISFLFTGGIFVLMAVLGVAALILLGVMLLLSLRQMLILALILLAPLAILGWIFPANTKLWSLWEGSFTKLLLIYPVIVFLTAVGRVFAYMIAETIFR